MHEIELKTYPKPSSRTLCTWHCFFPLISIIKALQKKNDNYDWGARLLIEIQMETERTTLVAN